MTKLNLETFEIITAITQEYAEDIESFILEEEDEVLQIDVAEIVMTLYHAYMEDDTNDSLLNLIGKKHIKINEVY
ncbi:hypothetical protein F10086_204 [Staphylococcus phage vB_SauM_JDF86]|nr:hypothetical protein F10086_204 [Staphylococcus phage vB_SauM_JDF86]